jgi:hypothetical protein
VFPPRWWMRHVTEAFEMSSPVRGLQIPPCQQKGLRRHEEDLIRMSPGPGVGLRRTSRPVASLCARGVPLHLHSHMVVFKPVLSKQAPRCDA